MPPKTITVSWVTSHPISVALGAQLVLNSNSGGHISDRGISCLYAQPDLNNTVYTKLTLPPTLRFWMKDPLLQANVHSEQQPWVTRYLGRTERDEMQGLHICVLSEQSDKNQHCCWFFGSTIPRFEQEQLGMAQNESKMTVDLQEESWEVWFILVLR